MTKKTTGIPADVDEIADVKTLRPYKFIVQAIVQQVDERGNVVGEPTVGRGDGSPFVLYGCDALANFAATFPQMIAVPERSTL